MLEADKKRQIEELRAKEKFEKDKLKAQELMVKE